MYQVPFLVTFRLRSRGPCLGFWLTSALCVLLQVRGSSVFVGFSSCPPRCSPSVLGSPLVGFLQGLFRSLCLRHVLFVFLFLLFCFVPTGDPRHRVRTRLFLPLCLLSLVLCPLLLPVLRPSVVCSFCGDASCCFSSFLVSCWCCCVLCVSSSCGGCAWGVLCYVSHCLLNVCVPRRQVPLQHAPPVGRSFLCPVLLSCCWSSVRSLSVLVGRLLVGACARLACVVMCACARVLVLFARFSPSWVFRLDSTFGLKPLFWRHPSSCSPLSLSN